MKHKNTKTQKHKNKLYLLCGVFIFSCFIVFGSAQAQTSPDAIAIRVIPNPQHYSALRWYQEQGFTGSPQALVIDGYEAVRDGRTVYVNAANAVGANLYTNIYLISYNQDSEQATQDIFSRILKHWHFNTNLTDSGDCVQEDYSLGDACRVDSDCQENEYCNSGKAKVTRDTIRMARMKDIDLLVEQYHEQHGHYPKLEAGTYVPNITISAWPSWQEALGKALGAELPIDPINRLADCPGYDPITCWNEQTREFAWATDLQSGTLPSCNYIFIYRYGSYHFCAGMETSDIYINIAEFNCFEQETPNNPPVITGVNLSDAYLVQQYSGYISASDYDNNQLNWALTINSGCGNWSNLRLEDTAVSGQKSIQADQAGQINDICNITITIDDNQTSGSISQDYAIEVVNRLPVITSYPITAANACVDYNYQVVAADADGHSLQYSATGLPADLTINQNTGEISGQPQTTGNYNIIITVTDEYSDSAYQAYALIVTDEIFQVNQISDTAIYVYPSEAEPPLHYGPAQFNHTATITTSNTVTYEMQNNPDWLIINSASGHIQGTPADNENDPGNYNITVTAENSCGARYSESFVLTVLENGWECMCADDTCENETCVDPIYGTICPGTMQCCPDIDNDGYDNCNTWEEGDDGLIIDCNDNNPNIHPNATEICGNGIDEDCNGSDIPCGPGDVDGCTDQDGDGYPGTDVGAPPPVNNEVNGQPEDYASLHAIEGGFKNMYDPNVEEIGQVTIRTDDYSGNFFRVYIPGGTERVTFTLLLAQGAKIGATVRLGLPPQEAYSPFITSDDYWDYSWQDDNGAKLSEIGSSGQDYQAMTYGGHITLVSDANPSTTGKWLYVKMLRFDSYVIGTVKFTAYINEDEYTNWYNNFDCWGADGDPLPLLGSCGGICDTSYLNFDCKDNNLNIYPNAPEICGNGVDDDCDGEVDEGC